LKGKLYFENLDSLRAIAALAVVFFHLHEWLPKPENDILYNAIRILSFNSRGGELGVHFFFILSGFLITYIIFSEKKLTQQFNLLRFYLRRTLRIWPLYFLTLIVGFIIIPNFIENEHQNSSALFYSIFLANFDNINQAVNNATLGVQWSVAIEEQFYLAWPLLFYLPKNIFLFLVLILIGCSEYFYFIQESWELRYLHTFSNCRFLFFGGLLAYFSFFFRTKVTHLLNLIPKLLTILIYIISVFILYFQYDLGIKFPLSKPLLHFISILFFGFVILDQTFSSSTPFRFGRIKILDNLGKVSYGLYLLHMIIIYPLSFITTSNIFSYLFTYIGAILLTIVFAKIIFKYFESPFLNIKKKFSVIHKE